MFLQLVDDVRAAFAARGFDQVEIADGIDASNAQTNYGSGGANRVVFRPAPDPIGFSPPKYIGEGDEDAEGASRRQLWTMAYAFEVAIAGYEPAFPERQLAHQQACVNIFEIVVQEVHRAYAGQYAWTSARWDDARKQGRFGAEFVATLTLNVPLFDSASVPRRPVGILANPVEKAP